MIGYTFLAISVSIDSLGIGLVYGIKNTKIAAMSRIILFFISMIITTCAVFLGNVITKILPTAYANYITIFILIFLGGWIIYQSLKEEKENSTGITVKILQDPIKSDMDNSKRIDYKEAFFLGFTLSLDSIGVGICSSIIAFNSLLFPILVASFQLVFLSVGIFFGKVINSRIKIPKNTWSIISGVLLIVLGISRIFF